MDRSYILLMVLIVVKYYMKWSNLTLLAEYGMCYVEESMKRWQFWNVNSNRNTRRRSGRTE